GEPAERIRIVTASAPYLVAVRDDLIAGGLDLSTQAIERDQTQVLGVEKALMTEATRHPIGNAAGKGRDESDRPGGEIVQDRDALARDYARLSAAFDVIEAELKRERERAESLAGQVDQLRIQPVKTTGHGPRYDPLDSMTEGLASLPND